MESLSSLSLSLSLFYLLLILSICDETNSFLSIFIYLIPSCFLNIINPVDGDNDDYDDDNWFTLIILHWRWFHCLHILIFSFSFSFFRLIVFLFYLNIITIKLICLMMMVVVEKLVNWDKNNQLINWLICLFVDGVN